MRPALECARRTAVKWLQSLYELLCLGVVLTIAGALMVPRERLLGWALYLCGAPLAGLLAGLPLSRSRVWLKLLAAIGLAGIAAYLLFGINSWMPVTAMAGIFLVYRGIRLSHASWEDHFPLPLSWFGLGLYLLTAFLFSHWEPLLPFRNAVSLLGLVLIVCMLFVMNHRAMRAAAHAAEAPVVLPRRMLKQNRWMTGILAAVVLLIGLFEQLRTLVGAVARAIVREIVMWFSRIPLTMHRISGGESLPPPLPPVSAGGNPFWVKVLDILFFIVAGIIILALAGTVAVVIWTGVRTLCRLIADVLGKRSEAMAEGYIDRRESLWDMRRITGNALNRTRRWFRVHFPAPERWQDMADNRQRMRYLYRRYVRRAMEKGFVPAAAATAAETVLQARPYVEDARIAERLLASYQAARYGEAMPSDADVAAVKDALDGRSQ